MPNLTIYFGDNLDILQHMPDSSMDLIYIDPPFNTGKVQARAAIKTIRDERGDRTGFKGRRYRTIPLGTKSYPDFHDDYLASLEPRLSRARELLKPNGSLFFHIDYREVHYCKILLDRLFGRTSFINEIIWAYDYGGRSKSRWPPKHDTILWYAKDPGDYQFHLEECDRIPYMAPSLVGPEKAARGKTPTDTWWHTIVSPTSREKTGYPTQKPLAILERIVKVHSAPGNSLLDFYAGSGTFGEAAFRNGRDCVLVDNNPQAMEVMAKRFTGISVEWHGWKPARAVP
ncbi:MAG: DNA methyltransferase [Spirochaetes bacterium]|nr:DNA methyltransferase [Spirochaetota bacterium]